MKKAIVGLLIIFMVSPITAQNFQDVVAAAETEEELDEICKSVYLGFTSTPKEVSKIIDQIVETAGVSNGGFELRQCSNIKNAVAKMILNNEGNEVRYIIYDSEWLQEIISSTNNDWSGKFVLAHEIGHHLNGHSLNNGVSNPKYELEADYFAGKALANLGASLEETLAVTDGMSVNASFSHPARADRAAKAEAGWKSVKNKIITIDVKNEDINEIAKELVNIIEDKLSSSYLSEEDYYKTLKQLNMAKSPKYYKGYTEDIWYYEALCYTGLGDHENAMNTYVNYLGIKGLDNVERIKKISDLYASSPIERTEIFANPAVVFNLSQAYFKDKKYDKAMSYGYQFMARSDNEEEKKEITRIIAKSEFEKIENEVDGIPVDERINKVDVYIKNQEYSKAVELLSPLVEKENAKAQFLMGSLYLNGWGLIADTNMASQLYVKAAQTIPEAQYAIGVLYMEGVGVSKSYENARFWLNKAKENGVADSGAALLKLSVMEETEKKKETIIEPVVKKTETSAESLAKKMATADSYFDQEMYKDAYTLYIEAAKLGDTKAQFRVGWMNYKGKGTSKNKMAAIDWWKSAAKKGNAEAINYLTRLGEW